jgi:hypothetical protein
LKRSDHPEISETSEPIGFGPSKTVHIRLIAASLPHARIMEENRLWDVFTLLNQKFRTAAGFMGYRQALYPFIKAP